MGTFRSSETIDAAWDQLVTAPPANDDGDCIALGDGDLFDVEPAKNLCNTRGARGNAAPRRCPSPPTR